MIYFLCVYIIACILMAVIAELCSWKRPDLPGDDGYEAVPVIYIIVLEDEAA